jgi:hypothetical protein
MTAAFARSAMPEELTVSWAPSAPPAITAEVVVAASETRVAAKPAVSARRHELAIVGQFPGEVWLGGADLIRPVRVQVQASPERVIAAEPETGIFGVGVDLPTALTDVRAALHEHLSVLEHQEDLSRGLQEQRDYLRQRVRQL